MGRWLDEAEELSRERLPAAVFDYVARGSGDEITLGEATRAWQQVRLLPHVLRDVSTLRLETALLGSSYAAPLGIAPMTLQRAADPEGEVAMARAARACGVPLVVSSNAGSTFAEVAETGVAWWLQAYLGARREDARAYLDDAVAAGARAVVLTVDTPVLASRRADGGSVWEVAERGWLGANPGVAPQGIDPGRRSRAQDLGPDDVAWLHEVTGLPVVVKGVLRGDDARRCRDAGAAAVWVSTHGGRQLDQASATRWCVAPVREAVGPDTQVYVDGGVRRGLHALVGLALGADAVFVGRPLYHALAADGVSGVRRGLDALREELEEAMRLCGVVCAEQCRDLVAGTAIGVREAEHDA